MRYSDDPSKDEVPDERVSLAVNLGQQGYSGQANNPRQEVEWYSGWSYMGINAKATQAASAKPRIYDSRKSKGDWEDDEENQERADKEFRWWKILKNPSPWQTGRQLRQECVMQLGIHGISVVWNVRNGWGKTEWRICVPVSLISPIQPGMREGMEYGGIRVHPSSWINQNFFIPISRNRQIRAIANREIPITDLTITAYPHPVLRGDGFSPQTAASKWNSLVNAAETEQANQYNKGSRKKVLLPLPDTIDPTTKEFDAYQRKVNRWMADDDMGFVALPRVDGALPISIEPDQMAYQTASEYGKNIMALSGTPSVAVGLSDNHTYGAIAAGLGAWTQLSVQPTLDLLADEDTATMRKEEGEAFTIAYEATKVADPEIELQETDQDIQAGTITVGELRKQRGRKPFGDERDDMIAGGEAIKAWGAPKEEPPADGVPAESGKSEAPVPPATSARDAIIQKQQRPMEALPNQTKSMFRPTEMVPLTGENRPPVIAFDLDGTLANKLDVYQPGLIGEPNKKMVNLAKMVRAAGCNVVVYTARNEDRAVARWLDDAGVPWCGINENPYVGQAKDGAKMLFDVLVDDRVTDARTMEAIVMQGIAGHLEPSWRNKVLDQFNRSTASDSYGFLFAPIGGQLAGKIRKIQDEIEPSHLAGSGIENELHVTILYGMVGEDESDIPKVFSQVSSPQFRLRKKLTAFDGQNGSTALVIELDGDDLHGVNAVASKAFAHVKTHPTYRPHITVAYVDSEHASKYENVKVTGASSKVETLVYRSQRGPDLVVPLRG